MLWSTKLIYYFKISILNSSKFFLLTYKQAEDIGNVCGDDTGKSISFTPKRLQDWFIFASPLATTTAATPTTTAATTGCGYPQWKGDGFCDVRFS